MKTQTLKEKFPYIYSPTKENDIKIKKFANPDTWILPCSNCNIHIKFEKYHRFHNAKSRLNCGHILNCLACKKTKQKVSKNPDDWKIPCSQCNLEIKYNNFDSFRTVYGKYLKGVERCCDNCNKEKYKTRKRKDAIYSFDPEDWHIQCSESNCINILKYTNRKSYQASKKLLNDGNGKICNSCAGKRARRLNNNKSRFKPAYNYRSIEFIEKILNERFNCKFIHAESNTGEFYIEIDGRCIYADAVSPELNLWIEFDEFYKFSFGKLLTEHVERHKLIKNNTNYNILRFHCNKQGQFNEYYNDLIGYGLSLNDQIKFTK